MARRRFFVPQVRRGTAEIAGDDAEHLVRVLRAEAGQLYEISDNQRVYLAEITSARKSLVVFEVREELPPVEPLVQLILVPALIKFDAFEWLVEKATELDVTEIRPCISARTEHGLERAAGKRMARWQKIAVEASQQSRRTRLPELQEPIDFERALKIAATRRLFLDEDPSAPPVLDQLPNERRSTDTIALLQGPEGGWTNTERSQAIAAGWLPCSLAPTVLRAETAATAALAVILAAWAQTHNAPVSRQPAES
jgi:16S rRNA (uracil1498-N3)-methyltransferase